jgi:hypothetical protein
VYVKDVDSHAVGALLASRVGRAKFNVFAARAEELIKDRRPELVAALRPLLDACKAIEQ